MLVARSNGQAERVLVCSCVACKVQWPAVYSRHKGGGLQTGHHSIQLTNAKPTTQKACQRLCSACSSTLLELSW